MFICELAVHCTSITISVCVLWCRPCKFRIVVQSRKSVVADYEGTGISIDNPVQTQCKLNGLTFPDVTYRILE
jgi:hypothetical protein